jgi:hypothetical protein
MPPWLLLCCTRNKLTDLVRSVKNTRDGVLQDACSIGCGSAGPVIRSSWRPYFRCLLHGRCVFCPPFFMFQSYLMPILQTCASLTVRWHFMPCSLMHAGPSPPASAKCTVLAFSYTEAKNQELTVAAGVLTLTPPCPAVWWSHRTRQHNTPA